MVRVACLQHCKRPFLEDDIKDNPDAREVARLTNSLYHNEHQHRIGEDGWTVEDNLRWRKEYAPPILAALKTKLEEIRDNLEKYPPKSQMHKAANYFLNEWDDLKAIAEYGDVEWDNNKESIAMCRYPVTTHPSSAAMPEPSEAASSTYWPAHAGSIRRRIRKSTAKQLDSEPAWPITLLAL